MNKPKKKLKKYTFRHKKWFDISIEAESMVKAKEVHKQFKKQK